MKAAEKEEILESARARAEDFKRFQGAGLVSKDGEYFPSVHYPPIIMYPPITEEEMFRTYTNPPDGLFDVYAHIPFCHQRCIFCHYPGKFGDRHAEKERYLDALEKEMDLYMNRLGLQRIRARSILLGGGTPTHLTPVQLKRFLEYFTARLDTTRLRQFNYDVDPATLVGPEGVERLQIMRDYGVDRLTIGVQSLDDEILKLMNRPHDARVALESIDNSRELGYQINIEFIFGHPGQTLDNWIEVMERAVTLDVEEIQLYRLKVDAYGDFQGPIKKYIERHPDRVPSMLDAIMMKQAAIEILNRNGYHENIRRVFSREKKHFSLYAHNQCCNLYDEIGFGLTAFSSLRDRFVLNTQYFDEYYDCIEKGQLPLNRGLVRDREQQIRWAVILPLKNRAIRRKLFERVTGASLDSVFRKKFEDLKRFGLVEEDDRFVRLTRLGAFFADEVAEQFHSPEYMPFPRDGYEPGPLYPYNDGEL
ncbi:coproporphyrinogen-III oxidase family protein [Verrucomicrobiota bacterium]